MAINKEKKALHIHIPSELHQEFKEKVLKESAEKGYSITMTEMLIDIMRDYLNENKN